MHSTSHANDLAFITDVIAKPVEDPRFSTPPSLAQHVVEKVDLVLLDGVKSMMFISVLFAKLVKENVICLLMLVSLVLAILAKEKVEWVLSVHACQVIFITKDLAVLVEVVDISSKCRRFFCFKKTNKTKYPSTHIKMF